MRRLPIPLTFLFAALPSFFLYNMTRTLQESIGFRPRITFLSTLFAIAAPTLLIALTLATSSLLKSHAHAKPNIRAHALTAALAFLLTIPLAELTILHDESQFAHEAHRHLANAPTAIYSRDRAWPNHSATLVATSTDIHATD